MRLSINFHYPISYVPYRHQNSVTKYAAASTEVVIRETTSADAPLVLKAANSREAYVFMRYGDPLGPKDDGSLREVRSYEGKLYAEVGPAGRLQEDIDTDLSKTQFSRCEAFSPTRTANELTTIERIMLHERNPLRSHNDDKGQRKADELAARAKDLLIVDGMLFQHIAEPVLKIDQDKAILAPRPAPIFIDPYLTSNYNLFHGGHGITENLVHADYVVQAGVDIQCGWEVVDPSWFRFDGTSHDVCKRAGMALATLTQNAAALDRDALDAMYVLRDAHADASGRVTPRLLGALRHLCEVESDPSETEQIRFAALRNIRRSNCSWNQHVIARRNHDALKGGHESPALDSARRSAEKALKRYELRQRNSWEDTAPYVSSVRRNGDATPSRLAGFAQELFSPGQVLDACACINFPGGEALAAQTNGARIYVVSERNNADSLSIAFVRDGQVESVHGNCAPQTASELLGELIELSDADANPSRTFSLGA